MLSYAQRVMFLFVSGGLRPPALFRVPFRRDRGARHVECWRVQPSLLRGLPALSRGCFLPAPAHRMYLEVLSARGGGGDFDQASPENSSARTLLFSV